MTCHDHQDHHGDQPSSKQREDDLFRSSYTSGSASSNQGPTRLSGATMTKPLVGHELDDQQKASAAGSGGYP
jgi:hypothetical protein